MFDSRCFNIPREEVTNCVLWRQQDATRNSIQMLAQHFFSQKVIDNRSNNELQDMLFTQKGINWNDLPTYLKRGSCCIKNEEGSWKIDLNIPKFVNEGRNYIEDRRKYNMSFDELIDFFGNAEQHSLSAADFESAKTLLRKYADEENKNTWSYRGNW